MMNFNPYQYQQQQSQNGFVSVRSEAEARNYPVAPGNSITFKDETAPYVYAKTMGFSQFDRPTFEKFKLVKEELEIPEPEVKPDELESVKTDIEKIWGVINEIKAEKTTTRRKKDVDARNDE